MNGVTASPATDLLGDLLGPEIILPDQFWVDRAATSRGAPERRLMLAVLENAMLTLHRHLRRPSPHARRLAAEIHAWVASNSRTHPFAFAAICDALGLDVSYVRGMVRKWGTGQAPVPRARRRHAGRSRHQLSLRRRRKSKAFVSGA